MRSTCELKYKYTHWNKHWQNHYRHAQQDLAQKKSTWKSTHKLTDSPRKAGSWIKVSNCRKRSDLSQLTENGFLIWTSFLFFQHCKLSLFTYSEVGRRRGGERSFYTRELVKRKGLMGSLFDISSIKELRAIEWSQSTSNGIKF